jgi:hypothetical protein
MNKIKILWLKYQLWREMRPLSPEQKKQLVRRIWWEIDLKNRGTIEQEIRVRIYATKLYKEQIAKRFNN